MVKMCSKEVSKIIINLPEKPVIDLNSKEDFCVPGCRHLGTDGKCKVLGSCILDEENDDD